MTIKEEREIRRKRRAIKRAERERRREEWRLRKERRVNARAGGPIIVPAQDPTFAALRTYYPIYFCEACRAIKRQDFMFDEDVCLACHEGGIR